MVITTHIRTATTHTVDVNVRKRNVAVHTAAVTWFISRNRETDKRTRFSDRRFCGKHFSYY